MKIYWLLLAALGSCVAVAGDLPDPRITSGAIDPGITQQNIGETVCQSGYTRSVRPPSYFTNRLKKYQIREYGYNDTNPKNYEEDHLIPLNIGGAANDPKNLWPQPRNSQWNASKKDVLEYKLYRLVCDGKVTLRDAQQAYANDWIAAYRKYN